MVYIIYCRVYLSFKRQQYSSAQFSTWPPPLPPTWLELTSQKNIVKIHQRMQSKKTTSTCHETCHPSVMNIAVIFFSKAPVFHGFSHGQAALASVVPGPRRPHGQWLRHAPAAKSLRNWWVVLTKTPLKNDGVTLW